MSLFETSEPTHQWHTSSKAIPPNPSQRVLPTGKQIFKHIKIWGPLPFKPPHVWVWPWVTEENVVLRVSPSPVAPGDWTQGVRLVSRSTWLCWLPICSLELTVWLMLYSSSWIYLLSAGITVIHRVAQHLPDAEGTNLSPPSCKASILLTDPSLQPLDSALHQGEV